MKSGKHFPNYKFLRGLDRARKASPSLSLSIISFPSALRSPHAQFTPFLLWIAAIPSVRLDLSDFAPGVEKNVVRGSGCARSIPSFSLARPPLSLSLPLNHPPYYSFSRSVLVPRPRNKESKNIYIYIYKRERERGRESCVK